MPAFTDYSIAAGWNNVDDLEPIGLVVATSNIAFPEPAGAQSGFVPGIIKIRFDQVPVTVGLNRQRWVFGNLTYEQYRYLQTAYFGDGFGGKVTVRTRWQRQDYDNYNAIAQLRATDLQATFQGYASVFLDFVDLRLIA